MPASSQQSAEPLSAVAWEVQRRRQTLMRKAHGSARRTISFTGAPVANWDSAQRRNARRSCSLGSSTSGASADKTGGKVGLLPSTPPSLITASTSSGSTRTGSWRASRPQGSSESLEDGRLCELSLADEEPWEDVIFAPFLPTMATESEVSRSPPKMSSIVPEPLLAAVGPPEGVAQARRGSTAQATTGEMIARAPLSPPRAKTPARDMLRKVLDRLIPLPGSGSLSPSLPSRRRKFGKNRSPSPQPQHQSPVLELLDRPHFEADAGDVTPLCCSPRLSSDCESLLFCRELANRFGSMERSFAAMRVAACHARRRSLSLQLPGRLGEDDFLWCVTDYLQYGPRDLGQRLYHSIAKTPEAGLSAADFVPMPEKLTDLLSLAEFRERLLECYSCSEEAWHDLEGIATSSRHNPSNGKADIPQVSMVAFLKKAAQWRLHTKQALHLFCCLDDDGDGYVAVEALSRCLEGLPAKLLLLDLRSRLLLCYKSVASALKKAEGVGDSSGSTRMMSKEEFAQDLGRIGIHVVEAHAVFDVLDKTFSDRVSLQQLRRTLRGGSPPVELDTFWHRFVAEWPDLVKSLLGDRADLSAFEAMIAGLIPEAHQPDSVGSSTCPPSASDDAVIITWERFDCVADKLDIAVADAQKLHRRIRQLSVERCQSSPSARAVQGTRSAPAAIMSAAGHSAEKVGIALEEFCDQLGLWLEEPCRCKRGAVATFAGSARRSVQRVVAQTRASISAFKAELGPPEDTDTGSLLALEDVASTPARPSGRLPKLPWRSYARTRTKTTHMLAS
eukprot:TRINITY_DN50956_c0_g1_i1.p1 TRINITY_DN50956_c0_g1~~TRINITY_DN50956_c0_g1_i1.p1  ORF type:complete len:788 (+),score=147.61 TRINITY_DN50956_c0_g1_i1:99-2462(+)